MDKLQLERTMHETGLAAVKAPDDDGAATAAIEARQAYLAALTAPADEPEPPAETLAAVEIREYVDAARQGIAVQGAAAELNQGLGLDTYAQVPLQALVEERADAATALTDGDFTVSVKPLMARVFAGSDLSFLGITPSGVPAGEQRYPVMTAGPTASARSRGQETDAVAASFTVTNLNPLRLTARVMWHLEDVYTWSGNALEAALRRDLRAVLADALDNSVLNGNGVAPQPSGVFHALTTPANPSAQATWADYKSAIVDAVDGVAAGDESAVRLLIGDDTWRHARGVYKTTDSESDGIDEVKRLGAAIRASSRIAAVASKRQYALRVAGNAARQIAVPVWNAFILEREPVAKTGQFALTASLLHNVAILRTDGLSELAFQILA